MQLKLIDRLYSIRLLTMVTIQPCFQSQYKTGKQVASGLFVVISALCFPSYNQKFLRTFLRLRLLVLRSSFVKKTNLFIVIQPKATKFRYFFPSHLFTFYLLVQLLLETVKLNGLSQPISTEHNIVHGFNQAVFRT